MEKIDLKSLQEQLLNSYFDTYTIDKNVFEIRYRNVDGVLIPDNTYIFRANSMYSPPLTFKVQNNVITEVYPIEPKLNMHERIIHPHAPPFISTNLENSKDDPEIYIALSYEYCKAHGWDWVYQHGGILGFRFNNLAEYKHLSYKRFYMCVPQFDSYIYSKLGFENYNIEYVWFASQQKTVYFNKGTKGTGDASYRPEAILFGFQHFMPIYKSIFNKYCEDF
jgi:hypothetical protein